LQIKRNERSFRLEENDTINLERGGVMSSKKEGIMFTTHNMIVIAAIVISGHPLVYTRYATKSDNTGDLGYIHIPSEDEERFYGEVDETIKKLNRWMSQTNNSFSGVAQAMEALGIEITGEDLEKVLQKINNTDGNTSSESEEDRLSYLLPPPGTTIN